MKRRRSSRIALIGRRQLPKSGLAEAAEAPEQSPCGTEDWPGGDSGQFIVAVGFMEGTMGHAEPAQPIHAVVQVFLASETADDEMRMDERIGKEMACHFDGRVAGLDYLMGMRQVFANEEVHIRSFVVLEKRHGFLPWVEVWT